MISSSNKSVAFVWTEFQQKILSAILLQEQQQIDVLFIRKGIGELSNLSDSCERVVYLPNIHCSYRNSRLLRQVIEAQVRPVLKGMKSLKVYSWTVEHPYVRSAIFSGRCDELHLFEDGTGSYIDLGWFNQKLGLKEFLSKLALHASLFELGGFRVCPKDIPIYGWSLFPGAYPGLPARRKALFHHSYRSSISSVNDNFLVSALDIPEGSIIYIPSPYADCNLVSNDEEVEMHSQALKKLTSNNYISVGGTVYWKPHPRANPIKERDRIRRIEEKSGLFLRVVEVSVGMESFALENEKVALSFFSLASTSLYGISALGIDNHKVFAIKLKVFTDKFPHVSSLYEFFDKSNVIVID